MIVGCSNGSVSTGVFKGKKEKNNNNVVRICSLRNMEMNNKWKDVKLTEVNVSILVIADRSISTINSLLFLSELF